jgi:GntR family transcriptional regulator/MocR family aminotransferase
MSDFLQLHRASAPAKGLTTWLADALRGAIVEGRLTVGSRLPATRTLAADLSISRGVVVDAYQRLVDEGLAEARTGAGTVVTSLGPPRRSLPIGAATAPLPEAAAARLPVDGAAQLSARAAGQLPALGGAPLPWTPAGPAFSLRLPLAAPPGIDIDLSPGVPDLAAFPRAAWLRAERAVLAEATTADLGYGDPAGSPRLRHELAAWLGRTRRVQAAAGDVIVVNGVAQALALLAQVLRRAVAVEDPGSRGARDQLAHWGLRAVPVPVDEQGMQIDELRRTGLDLALLTPAHQFPTGVVLSPRRRAAFLDWAVDGNLIIEDDYDAEHRYDRAPVAALQASAPDLVAYAGSTSKSLAPGMRLGWLVAPSRLRTQLIAAKHASDLGNPGLPQLVLAHLLASGGYERHLRAVRTRQRIRRDALLAGLREHLPGARVEGVAAGLHLLIMLPGQRVDDVELAGRIGAAGVLVQPLSWHRQRPGPPGLVLGYAAQTPDRLREAARRLGQAVDRQSSTRRAPVAHKPPRVS